MAIDFTPENSAINFVPEQSDPSSRNDMRNALSYASSSPITDSIAKLPGDITTGLANAGQGLANFPHRLFPSAPAAPNIDFNQLLAPNSNSVDKLIQGVSQYAPFGVLGRTLGAGEALANEAGTGSLYGATQSKNPAEGSVVGGVSNALTHGAGVGVSALAKGLKNYLSQYAAQGLSKNISNSLNSIKDTNQQAFEMAKANYSDMADKEGKAWDSLTDMAKDVDANKPVFDNTSYVNSLADKLGQLKEQSQAQSGLARKNKDSIQLIEGNQNSPLPENQGYLNDQHSSFSDAFAHNKGLNADYQNEIAPGQPLPFQTVNFAKSALKKTINENIENNGLQDTLGAAWNDANSLTSQKNQIFNNVVNNAGREQISKFSGMINGKSNYTDPTSFVSDYVPSSRTDGIQKMQQFSQMLGDSQKAKDILKANYFDKSYGNGSFNGKDFLNKYNALSPEQQSYLFSPQENQNIKSLLSINSTHPEALNKNLSESLISHALIPTAIGGAAGHFVGGHELAGALAAPILMNSARFGLNRLFENPTLSNYLVSSLKSQGQQPGIASSSLSNILPMALTPQLINSIGAQ